MESAPDNKHPLQVNTRIPGLKVGDVIDDRFQLKKHLGTGSLGCAYICQNTTGPSDEFVIKLIHQRYNDRPGFINSFSMLTKSAGSIKHESICRILDFGRCQQGSYYTMERIPGYTLRMWLLHTFSFEERVIKGLQFISQYLSAVQILHDNGHFACMKPENLFISGERPIISDYWIPGFIPPGDFSINPAAGSYLVYMAPEVKDDWSTFSQASDIYGTGALLYEILLGRPPIGTLLKPSLCSNFYTEDFDIMIDRSLALSPEDRYTSAVDMQMAIQTLLQLLNKTGNADVDDQKRDSEILRDIDSIEQNPAAISLQVDDEFSQQAEDNNNDASQKDIRATRIIQEYEKGEPEKATVLGYSESDILSEAADNSKQTPQVIPENHLTSEDIEDTTLRRATIIPLPQDNDLPGEPVESEIPLTEAATVISGDDVLNVPDDEDSQAPFLQDDIAGDASPLNPVTLESGNPEPEFSLDDEDVQDIQPDVELSAKERRERTIKKLTGEIPLVKSQIPKGEADEEEELSPLPVWAKVLLIIIGLTILAGAIAGSFFSRNLF